MVAKRSIAKWLDPVLLDLQMRLHDVGEPPEVLNGAAYEKLRDAYGICGLVDEDAFLAEWRKDPYGAVTWAYCRGGVITVEDMREAMREDANIAKLKLETRRMPVTLSPGSIGFKQYLAEKEKTPEERAAKKKKRKLSEASRLRNRMA